MNDSYQWEPRHGREPEYKAEPQGGPPPERDNSKTWLGLLLASPVVAALIAGLFTWAPWQHSAPNSHPSNSSTPSVMPSLTVVMPSLTINPSQVGAPAIPGDQSVYVDPTSGAGGTLVRVSGDGFPANAQVVFLFSTYQMGDTTTNGDGKFSNVSVTIPTSFGVFAPQQFYIIAESGAFSAQTPFMLTG